MGKMRTCKTCGELKPIDEFRRLKMKTGNIKTWGSCKSCLYKRDAENVRSNPRRKAYYVIARKHQEARRTGSECDLDLEWYVERLDRGFCEVTGYQFQVNTEYGATSDPYEPTIDRIDPSGPYTKANCRLVVRIYNIARGNYSDDILLDFCRRMVEVYDVKKAA